MKYLFTLCAAILASLILAPSASAQVNPACTYTEQNGTTKNCVVLDQFTQTGTITTNNPLTITTGGTAQTALAANTQRVWLWCQNPPSATESLFINFSGTAGAANGSIELVAGQVFVMQSNAIYTGIVSAYAATTGHAFTCKQG